MLAIHRRHIGLVGAVVTLALGCLTGCSEKGTEPPPPPQDLLARLDAIPGSTVTEITPPAGYHFTRAFRIELSQPVDHAVPGGAHFVQPFFLLHTGTGSPMHLCLSGYSIGSSRVFELSSVLRANQIYVGHRYVGGVGPEPPSWEHLTIQQAAADIHRIVAFLKPIYTGPWISSGRSKGGIAAICHRRFYPADVAVTVPFVAPVMFDTADSRFDQYLLNEAGDAACRGRIMGFQRAVLNRRDSLLPLLETHVQQSGSTFRLGLPATFEISVLELLFSYWQVGPHDCQPLPDSTASTSELYDYFMQMSGIDWLSDNYMNYYSPVFYQMYTELGYYRLITEHVADLLQEYDAPSYSLYCPQGVPRMYRPEVMADVSNWLMTEGNNFIYVYGGIDPYTSARVGESSQTNSISIVQPGADHSVDISGLTVQREELFDSLESWLGVEVYRVYREGANPPAEPGNEIERFLR